jgi:hypothetical protein
MKNLYGKLLELQKKIEPLTKDKTNPFYKSQYFDINGVLSAVKPIASELGLIILQPLTNVDGKPAIKTLIIDADSGESIEGITVITNIEDAQKQGSAITYFRRYSLQSMLGLEAEDDDANRAVSKKEVSDIANGLKNKIVLDMKKHEFTGEEVATGMKELGYIGKKLDDLSDEEAIEAGKIYNEWLIRKGYKEPTSDYRDKKVEKEIKKEDLEKSLASENE